MIQIALVDDHKLFRKSLAMFISSFRGMEVALEAENGKIFIERLRETPIDIVLLDIQMPEMNGFETCKILHSQYPKIKILIVSQLSSRESIHKVLECGAHGYFTKNSDPNLLRAAIMHLKKRGYYFDIELNSVIKEAMIWEKRHANKAIELSDGLSPRDLQIIMMAANEMSSAEIGEKLGINKRTVESHKIRIMEITNCKNFVGVILYALRNEFFFIEDVQSYRK